jgi:hypothetical protein
MVSFDLLPSSFCLGSLKDLTALGGKVGRAGPGVEAEEGEGVEVGGEGVKLLTLGVGETDQDAVLQPGQAQIDSIEIASQQLVLELPDIIGRLGGGGVEAPCLGLVEKVIDQVNELGRGLGYFGNHVRIELVLYFRQIFSSRHTTKIISGRAPERVLAEIVFID